MNFARQRVLVAIMALALAGCGPSITVENKTSFDVHAMVINNGRSECLSPSPGNSSTTDAAEGMYTVVAVRSSEWITWAKATRQYLNDQLARMDSLTGAQLFEVVQRLKDIAKKMAEYENVKSGASCSGRITEDTNGAATISLGPGGALVVACK